MSRPMSSLIVCELCCSARPCVSPGASGGGGVAMMQVVVVVVAVG